MLKDQTVTRFLEGLGEATATPGGGSAAALAGALAAALAAMVAGLTVNKKGFEEVRERMSAIQGEATGLMHELAGLVDRDAEAYRGVMAAFRLPKESDGEKAARLDAIQQATLAAAQTPLETLRACRRVADLLTDAATHGNPNAGTDAAVGALLMSAGAEGAYRNIAVNLDSLKDGDAAAALRREADRLLAECHTSAHTVRRTLFED